MKYLSLIICLLFTLSLSSVAVAGPTAGGNSTQSVEVAKKKKKKKKKKRSTKCKVGYKKSGSKCKKGPYRKGQTCVMDKSMEYQKYGFICLDLSTPGFPLTYLDAYKH